jgi:hypothetical protein
VQGFLELRHLLANFLIASLILWFGMVGYRKLNYLLRRNAPILLLFTVYFEAYTESAENFDSILTFNLQFASVVVVLCFLSKIPTWFKAFNNSKYPYNDEVVVSVLFGMRISMLIFNGYKPLRNPL